MDHHFQVELALDSSKVTQETGWPGCSYLTLHLTFLPCWRGRLSTADCSCSATFSQSALDRQYTMPHCTRPMRSTNLSLIMPAMSSMPSANLAFFLRTSYLRCCTAKIFFHGRMCAHACAALPPCRLCISCCCAHGKCCMCNGVRMGTPLPQTDMYTLGRPCSAQESVSFMCSVCSKTHSLVAM